MKQRRRRNPLLVELVPWWAFIAMGAAVYAFMRWGAQYVFSSQSMFDQGLVMGLRASAIFAWYCGVILAVLAGLVALIQQRFPSTR